MSPLYISFFSGALFLTLAGVALLQVVLTAEIRKFAAWSAWVLMIFFALLGVHVWYHPTLAIPAQVLVEQFDFLPGAASWVGALLFFVAMFAPLTIAYCLSDRTRDAFDRMVKDGIDRVR